MQRVQIRDEFASGDDDEGQAAKRRSTGYQLSPMGLRTCINDDVLILGQILQPGRGIDQPELRNGRSGHDRLFSGLGPLRFFEDP